MVFQTVRYLLPRLHAADVMKFFYSRKISFFNLGVIRIHDEAWMMNVSGGIINYDEPILIQQISWE